MSSPCNTAVDHQSRALQYNSIMQYTPWAIQETCHSASVTPCGYPSQNHGYAIDSSTLPSGFKEYFVNLNDGSNEGMIHKTRPIFSTQFHPEAKGGPQDSSCLFEKYLDSVRLAKSKQLEYKDNRPSQLTLDILSKEHVGVAPVPLASAA